MQNSRGKPSVDISALFDELREANSFLDSLIENIPNMIFVKDAKDLRFVRFNRAGEELLGISRADLIGKSDFDLFKKEDALAYQATDRRVLEEGLILDIPEEKIDSPRLGERYLHTKKIPLRDSSGTPVYLLGISEDITEQKLAAAAERQRLQEEIVEVESAKARERLLFLSRTGAKLGSSLDFEETLSNLTKLCVPAIADWCSVQTVNSDGTLSQIAVAHKDPDKTQWSWDLHHRYSNSALHNFGPYHVLRGNRGEIISEVSDEMLEEITADTFYLQKLREAGLQSYICAPIRARNRVIGTLTLVTTRESGRKFSSADLNLAEDLGERAGYAVENARLYKESSNLNRIKDEFLATLSHELRTPMNVIKGHAEILKDERDKLSPQQIKNSIEAIYRNASSQHELISDLLDVSSIVTGKISYRPLSIEPAQAIETLLSGMMATANSKGVSLFACFENAPARVVADPNRLHQIVWNLLSNAIKFTPRSGSVRVSVGVENDEWTITVTDSGAGIDPDFLPFVFDRFRQEDASTTRVYGGLGLGLSIVRHLTELHGGHVSVSSEGKGRGSSFKISLPFISNPSASEAASPPQVPSFNPENEIPDLHGMRVMLVEDSVDNRELIKFYLDRAGADVIEAESASSARELLHQQPPDIIVSDIGLPDENGIEMIRSIRRDENPRVRNIPAVALTAYVRDSERDGALAAGFQRHLGKPVSAPILIRVIHELLS